MNLDLNLEPSVTRDPDQTLKRLQSLFLLILTSCLLISLVEKVPFRWMSSVSDHSVLFLLLGGVGAAALLQGFWGAPGDLPSPRKEA